MFNIKRIYHKKRNVKLIRTHLEFGGASPTDIVGCWPEKWENWRWKKGGMEERKRGRWKESLILFEKICLRENVKTLMGREWVRGTILQDINVIRPHFFYIQFFYYIQCEMSKKLTFTIPKPTTRTINRHHPRPQPWLIMTRAKKKSTSLLFFFYFCRFILDMFLFIGFLCSLSLCVYFCL